ncbi:MAG: gamma-glutamyl phosphate reductase [Planctomycetota bacterium]|nr:MAG: gamma-glutamyl phosphate reductase [Planctomycetota bacterium]
MAEGTGPGEAAALARAVRAAQRGLGAAPAAARTEALQQLAALLAAGEAELLAANRRDRERAEQGALAPPLYKRLVLDAARLATLREGVLQLAATPDPIGRPRRRTELDAGLVLSQVSCPLGVLLVIFESRPDVVVQIGALAIRSGNGVILKGGREALHSNRALVGCLQQALRAAALPAGAIALVEGREAVAELLELPELIDVVIPRGSGQLVRQIQAQTRIPVLGHSEGVCHLYVDRAADPEMALRLALDGKCDYPAACNATEALLVHAEFLPQLGRLGAALAERGVELRADARARAVLPWARPATEQDWGREFGDLILAVRVVDSIEEAIAHIHRYGSGHTDAIVTADRAAAERFLAEVDAASVFWNASTRFADGYRYGLGAEVGIATGRIHARGPVGLEGLLTTRWLLRGSGQAAGEYGPGGRRFTHRALPLEDAGS